MKKFLFNEGPVKIEVGDIISQLCDLEEFHTGDYRWSALRRSRPGDSLNLIEIARYLILGMEDKDNTDETEDIDGPMFHTLLLYSRQADWCDEWGSTNYSALPLCGTHYWLSYTEMDDPREWKKL